MNKMYFLPFFRMALEFLTQHILFLLFIVSLLTLTDRVIISRPQSFPAPRRLRGRYVRENVSFHMSSRHTNQGLREQFKYLAEIKRKFVTCVLHGKSPDQVNIARRCSVCCLTWLLNLRELNREIRDRTAKVHR